MAFLDNPHDPLWGQEVTRLTGLPSGTVQPILDRLHARQQIEPVEPEDDGDRRHRFRLTESGASYFRGELTSEAVQDLAKRGFGVRRRVATQP